MGVLTEAEIEQKAAEYLNRSIAYVTKRWGVDAAQYAGEGLFSALQSYNGSTSLDAWINTKLKYAALEGLRTMNGRIGTTAHRAREAQCEFQDFDSTHFAEEQTDELERREQVFKARAAICLMPSTQYLIATMISMGPFSPDTIAKVLGVTRNTIAKTLTKIRTSGSFAFD